MIHKHYEGLLKTSSLWKGNLSPELKAFEILSDSNKIDIKIDDNLRLGKYVERLISFELKQQDDISILAENIQIQDNKITLGELDFLILKNNQPIHLEVIYKFYLYDPTVGTTEIDHFIGPNRKDSLNEKLKRLNCKQLPILHSAACKSYLDNLNLNPENISQQVYFKAQLFMPFSSQDTRLNILNNECISGFYIRKDELLEFQDCKFYIPSKKDWLIIAHTNIDWLNFNDFKTIANSYLNKEFSPLLWVKLKSGELKKVFLVWW